MTEEKLYDLLIQIGIQGVVRRGNNFMFRCPSGQHVDRRPSCGIKIDDPHPWGCFGCNFKGTTLYTFLLQAGNMTSTQANIICEIEEAVVDTSKFTLTNEKKPLRTFSEEELFPFFPTQRSDTYFRLRGLSLSTIRELNLMHDVMENRVIYPWYLDGKLAAITGRTLSSSVAKSGAKIKSYLPGMSKRDLVYLPSRKITNEPLVLVEGEFDAAKVYEAGIRNVAALGHAKFSEGQLNLTLNSPASEIVIFTDDDKSGLNAIEIITEALKGKRIVRTISYDAIRDNYEHLLSRGQKLDPGVLTPEDIREILAPDSRQLFPDWPSISSCRQVG